MRTMADSGQKIIPEVNSNFHHIAGDDLLEKSDRKFREYRKKWKDWPASFSAGSFPLFIDIEVTSACNLKCEFCATTYRDKDIKKGFISFDTVKKIINEGASAGLYGVKFNIRGEPLLHGQIAEFVKYAKDKGLIDVYFNTNAMLLDKKASRSLIDAGLDRLSISFEGHTKEVYERHRLGSDFDTVLSNIEHLQSLKKQLGVRHPKIRIQTVMLPELKPFFDQYKRFWSDKVDEIGFLDYKEMKNKKRGLKFSWACPQLWQRLAIWWDGTILPCNHDDQGLMALGNVNQVSISDCWRSAELAKIREFHKNGMSDQVAACDGCYLRDSEINKIKERDKAK